MTEQLQCPAPELTYALKELCAHLVMTEELWHPTLELTYTLEELCARLVMRSSCGAPHQS